MRTWIETSKSLIIDYAEVCRFQKGMEAECRFLEKGGVYESRALPEDEILVMFSGGIRLSSGEDSSGRHFNFIRHALLWSDLCIGSLWQKCTRERQTELAGAGFDLIFAEEEGNRQSASRAIPVTKPNKTVLFRVKGLCLAIVYSVLKKEADPAVFQNSLQESIRKARKDGAEFVFVLIKYQPYLTPKFKIVSTVAADAGADYIIGDNGELYGERCYDRMDIYGRIVPRVYTLGAFAAGGAGFKKDSIVLRVKLRKKNEGVELIEQSYVPCFTANKANGISNVVLPVSSKPIDGPRPQVLVNTRVRIGKCYTGLPEIQSFLNFEGLFEMLDLSLPKEYEYLGYKSAGFLYPSLRDVLGTCVCFLKPYDTGKGIGEEEYYDRMRQGVPEAMRKGAYFFFSPIPLGNAVPHLVHQNPIILYNKVMRSINKTDSLI